MYEENVHIFIIQTVSHGVLMLARINLKHSTWKKKKCNSHSCYTEEFKAKFCYTKPLSAVYNYHRNERE
jgi:hypothetical protein